MSHKLEDKPIDVIRAERFGHFTSHNLADWEIELLLKPGEKCVNCFTTDTAGLSVPCMGHTTNGQRNEKLY